MRVPQGHPLPFYQRKFPLYDRYFYDFFRCLSDEGRPASVIDIGANIGDTAHAILSVSTDAKLVCVEGAPHFLPFLHENTSRLEQVRVVPKFLTVGAGEEMGFVADAGTGHLAPLEQSDAVELAWTTVSDVLAIADDFFEDGVRIWKSDTDGYDLEIAALNWDAIVEACDGMWLEWDIFGSQGTPAIPPGLIAKVAESGLRVVIFDNFGQSMFNVGSEFTHVLLEQLSAYLDGSARAGVRRIYYCDVWLLPEGLASLLWSTAGSAFALRESR